MAIAGSTSKPTSSTEWHGQNLNNQITSPITMPEKGRVTRVGMWMRGMNASVSTYLALWTPNGGLLRASGLFTVSGASFSNANIIQVERDLSSPLDLNGGVTVWVGHSRNPNGAMQYGLNSGGTRHRKTVTSGWPGTMSGAGAQSGSVGVYFYYDTGFEVFVRRGGAWVQADEVYVRRSGVWVPADNVRVRRSGNWEDL